MDPVDALLEARDLLAQGFVKYRMWDTNARGEKIGWCALGALRCATNTNLGDYSSEVFRVARSYAERALPDGRRLVQFNNAPETTQQDMVELFDRAATLAKEEA